MHWLAIALALHHRVYLRIERRIILAEPIAQAGEPHVHFAAHALAPRAMRLGSVQG